MLYARISLGYFPACYDVWQNILPAPVISLQQQNRIQGVFITPNIGSNWQRLAGARVLLIKDQDPEVYIDYNQAYRVCKLLGPWRVRQFSIYELQDIWYEFLSVLGQPCWSYAVKSTKIETVNVLYLANFSDVPFPDGPSSAIFSYSSRQMLWFTVLEFSWLNHYVAKTTT